MPGSTPEERSHVASLGSSASVESRAIERYLQVVAGLWEPPAANEEAVKALEQRIRDEPRLVKRVQLVADLERLESPDRKRDAIAAEEAAALEGFVKHAGSFTERNGITYKAWRSMGVSPAVLKQAGVKVPASAADPKRTYAARKGTRTPMTPEYGQKILDLYEEAGGDANKRAAYDVIAEHFEYRRNYVGQVLKGARLATSTGKQAKRDDGGWVSA